MQILSLGEDQGPNAHRIIEEAMKIGSWVLLQNCHLEPNWMSALEKVSVNTKDLLSNFHIYFTYYYRCVKA